MTIISATLEAEIRKIPVQSQPRQIVQETLFQKKKKKPKTHKNPQKRAGEVAQGVGPQFIPQSGKKKIFLPKKPSMVAQTCNPSYLGG
jgi:hypothetical protein